MRTPKSSGSFVIRFALPFALFEGAVKTAPEKLGNVGFFLCLIFGLMGTYVIALAVGRLLFKHDLRTATMQALVCAYPDMAYFGAPILAAMFGPEGFWRFWSAISSPASSCCPSQSC